MREIKFRAWDKEKKEMFDVMAMNFGCKGVLGLTRDASVAREIKYPEYDVIAMDKIILMQYTGLKDKNRKEIYGKDVVLDNVGRKWVVEYLDSEGAFVFIYLKNRKQYQTYYRFIEIQKPLEIIGNIYENPELKEI